MQYGDKIRIIKKNDDHTIDHYSYQLGVMDCFCEMVAAGLKTLAMSHPCDTKEERDSYLEDMKKICEKYEVKYYPEDEALLTDLFSEKLNKDKYNYLFFRTDDVLERYLELKERQKDLKRNGAYTKMESHALAQEFGRLLSYPEEGIERMIKKADVQIFDEWADENGLDFRKDKKWQ